MVKLIIASVLSAALAIGSEHYLNQQLDKSNANLADTIATSDSIPVNLPTRSIIAPAIEAPDEN
jgi:hypothetical protein